MELVDRPVAYRLSLLVVLVLNMAVIQAQPLSLSDYVADSVSRHPLVLEQVHIFRQAEKDQTIASSGWRPSVDLLATSNRIDGEYPTAVPLSGTQISDYSSRRVELSVTQNLFDGFETSNR